MALLQRLYEFADEGEKKSIYMLAKTETLPPLITLKFGARSESLSDESCSSNSPSSSATSLSESHLLLPCTKTRPLGLETATLLGEDETDTDTLLKITLFHEEQSCILSVSIRNLWESSVVTLLMILARKLTPSAASAGVNVEEHRDAVDGFALYRGNYVEVVSTSPYVSK